MNPHIVQILHIKKWKDKGSMLYLYDQALLTKTRLRWVALALEKEM